VAAARVLVLLQPEIFFGIRFETATAGHSIGPRQEAAMGEILNAWI
jgi:hypothetical protein